MDCAKVELLIIPGFMVCVDVVLIQLLFVVPMEGLT